LKQTLKAAQAGDILELDELWCFVFKKTNKRWLWTALCRRTRQVVAFINGKRNRATCLKLYLKLPYHYRQCHSFSDFWNTYQEVFPEETHHCVGKESGETAHMERWYNTLRQRNARFVRKTLSFSKSEMWHDMVTKWMIIEHNLQVIT